MPNVVADSTSQRGTAVPSASHPHARWGALRQFRLVIEGSIDDARTDADIVEPRRRGSRPEPAGGVTTSDSKHGWPAPPRQALAEKSYISPIDVLIGVGWLTPQAVVQWRPSPATVFPTIASVGSIWQGRNG